jgi:hypothetical protein
MKHLIFCLVICLAAGSLLAQVPEVGAYEARFDVKIRDAQDNHSGSCTNKFEMFTTMTGGSEQNSWYVDLNPIGTSWKTIPTKYMTIPIDKKLTKVRFRGERNWKNWGGCNGDDGWSETNLSYTGCMTRTLSTAIPEWASSVVIKIYPKPLNIYYFNRADQYISNSALYYLPQNHKIQIKATSGYPNSVYGWQYQIGSGTWTNFPTSLYAGNVLTFSGNDLPSINFINDVLLANKNVKVRLSYGCSGFSSIMTLRPLLSSPDMTNAEPIAPSCSYLNDGKIKVTFSRALYSGETLTFALDGLKQTPENIATLDADNTFTLTGFASFSNRILSIKGRFNGLDTYTDDPTTQNKTVSVPVTLPVTFAASPFDVHCHAGEDGRINVSAQGGAGNYTSYLVKATDTLQQINLTSSASNNFTGLKADTYTVRLRDSNQCDSRDNNGDPITIPQTIAEPAVSVSLTAVENIEPKGFGLTNGYITVRAERGTYPYSFEWTNDNNASFTADASVTEGQSMKSTLSNIGKDVYHIIAKDDQYALASPQTEVNIRGCYDTLTVVMDEPPLLEVAIRETHYVSCYGYDDGELMAHATGGRPYLSGSPNEPYLYEWFSVNGNTLSGFGESDSVAFERPSNLYRIKVTDRNGIVAWSPAFMLIQPDALKLTFNTSELLCNGDTDGESEVLPAGGTSPYRYAWSNEETTKQIGQLSDGIYSVVVVDTRGCTTMGQTEVTVPNGLAVEAIVTSPVCKGDANGAVELTVTGGVPAYKYTWNEGSQTSSINNLTYGTYTVHIEDANKCFIDREYILENPSLFAINLGPDRVLCKDQTLSLNPVIEDQAAQYTWTKNNTAYASTSAVVLTESGTYKVLVVDSKGCENEDEITITRDDTEIAASLVVATRVPQGGKVHITNITFPSPDKMEWIIPQEATVLDKKTEYVELSFATKGSYAIGIKSYKGLCEKTSFSQVQVVDRSELTDYITPDEPYIKQFMVTPNPNNGKFNVVVELKETATFKLILYANQSTVVQQDDFTNQSYLQKDYDVTSAVGSGLYILQLITPKGQSTFKIMINK